MDVKQKKKICCFGEMLWDIVPRGKHPGGAPLNVAYHLAKFESDVSLISKVGEDADGQELQRLAVSWDIDTSLLQVDGRYGTGRVNAEMLENGEVEYDIKSKVAWDYIGLTPKLKDAVKESGCFIYGSLSARNEQSRDTLLELLEEADFKIFDINLRFPHYELETLDLLLKKADILKLNNWELVEINKLLGLESQYLEEARLVGALMERSAIKQVIVTKGKDGAAYYSDEKVIHQTSEVIVRVEDTIGCGDAFLAAFIVSYLDNLSVEVMLKKAVAMGAFLATKPGGCPPYRLSEYEEFYNDNYLQR